MRRKIFLILLMSAFGIVSAATLLAKPLKAERITSVMLPAGYRIDRVVTGLTSPTAVAWDNQGRMLIAEAGAIYGSEKANPGQIIRIEDPDRPIESQRTVVATDLFSPVSDVKVQGEDMYVAHRGCLSVWRDGKRQDLITGLPSGDHSTCEIAFDEEGMVYLGNGTVTNAGVVGDDSFQGRWASESPQGHDVSAKDILLTGQNVTTPDPRTKSLTDTATTGAFVPFGTATGRGQLIEGRTKASGVILKVRPDGTGLEVYAWGLRNPSGLGFSPDGKLIATDQGYEDGGARPVAKAPDPVYEIEQGGWYGWPDFVAGSPITDLRYASERSPGSSIPFLLLEHPPVQEPLAKLEPRSGAMRFDFAPTDFDGQERMFIAVSGDAGSYADSYAGSDGGSHAGSYAGSDAGSDAGSYAGSYGAARSVNSRILALNLTTGRLEAFAYNKAQVPAGRDLMGFNHPVDVKFGPDKCMYVVDLGVFQESGQGGRGSGRLADWVSSQWDSWGSNQGSSWSDNLGIGGVGDNRYPVPGTGVIWKISRQRSEYAQFSAQSAWSLGGGDDPWDPDYALLKEQLAEYISTFSEKWGLYFKDLDSGKAFGVNENVQVPAASTVKVPVVLYASHLASQKRLDMNERLQYRVERDWQGGAGSLQYTAKDGDTFSIRELAEKAIRESDNVAWKMLERRLGKSNIAKFMKELGGKVVYPWGVNISTPEDLAVYMEAALRFAAESPYGEKLMYDLSHTIWNTGLNRYITEVAVAHKEGDVSGVADDVGVVYAPHPYILSIMSRGHDDVELGFEKIGEISRMVYDYQVASARNP